jgi:hypothetical protein
VLEDVQHDHGIDRCRGKRAGLEVESKEGNARQVTRQALQRSGNDISADDRGARQGLDQLAHEVSRRAAYLEDHRRRRSKSGAQLR